MLQLGVQHLFPAFSTADSEFKSDAKGWKTAYFFSWTSEIGWYLKSNLRAKQLPNLQETSGKRKEIEPVFADSLYLKSKTKLKPHVLNNPFHDLIVFLTKLTGISQEFHL